MEHLVRREAGYDVIVEAERGGGGGQRTCDEVESRALARSIRSDETDNFAFAHFEGYPVDRDETPEAFGKLGGDQHFNPHDRAVPERQRGTKGMCCRPPTSAWRRSRRRATAGPAPGS